MEHAKKYFENNSGTQVLYFTSDNLAFFDEQNALNHAASLDDETVTTMTRDEVYNELEDLAGATWEDDLFDPLDDLDIE